MPHWHFVTVVAPPGVHVETDDDHFAESRTASVDPAEMAAPPTPDDPMVLRLDALHEAGTDDARRRARLTARAGGRRLVVKVPHTDVVAAHAIEDVRGLAAEAGVDKALLIVHARAS